MNKSRYDELDWFDQLVQDDYTRRATARLKARKERQATQPYPKSFKSLAARLKRFLGLS
jgi:hypothetical protein